MTTVVKNPNGLVFCPDCRSRNSWRRDKSRDIYSESGKLMWRAYKCLCGKKTIVKNAGYFKGGHASKK